MKDSNRSIQLDRFAILLSGVCLVHCLIAPIILTLLPIFSLTTLVEDIVFHQLMLWIIVPTSVVALILGCKKHRRWQIAISGGLGIMVLFMVAFIGHDLFSIQAEKVATTLGGLLLAWSHYLNYRACQSISCGNPKCASDHHH